MAVWPSGYGVRLRLHFFLLARGVVVGLSFAGVKFMLAARWRLLWFLIFFFPSEQTPLFQISRKPPSPSALSPWVVVYKNTHTHSIHNTTTTTCRKTKVAVPLLMSTSTTIYSPVQTCVLFNVIVSRVNSRFCSCCVCWYFSLRQQRTSIIIFITNASTSHEKQFETHSQMLSPSTRLLPIAWMVRFY